MQQIIFAQEVTDTSFETKLRINLQYLPLGDYYWRVKTRIPNAGDTWSVTQRVTISLENAVEDIIVGTENFVKWVENGNVHIKRGDKTYNLLGNIIN